MLHINSIPYPTKLEKLVIDNINDVSLDEYGRINRSWDFFQLAHNPGITWNFIYHNFHLFETYWGAVSFNENITLEIIKKYPDLEWDWGSISLRMPYSSILANMELPWEWKCISRRKDLPIDLVLKYPDKKWDWTMISKITLNFSPESNEYNRLCEQIRDLLIFSNGSLPRSGYLMMEIFEHQLTFLSTWDFVHIIDKILA